MRKPKIRELDQRITVFVRTETGSDSEDYPQYTDTDLFTTWAAIETEGPQETETGKAAYDFTSAAFIIRYRRAAIGNSLYIRHNGLVYAVVGFDPGGFHHEFLVLHAKRAVVQ